VRELKNALERERKSREKDGDSTHARDAEKSELPTIVERKNKQTHTHTHTHTNEQLLLLRYDGIYNYAMLKYLRSTYIN
jgi:hypothetical protein